MFYNLDMKKFFKIVLIIFILALSFLTEPQSLHAYQINNDGYIENVEKETGIFVLNNFLGEEIRPIKNETQPNISSSSSLATSIEENPKFLILRFSAFLFTRKYRFSSK